MKKTIYILTTGGTIAYRSSVEQGTAVMGSKTEDLLSELEIKGLDFEVRSIIQKGSMNITPDDWNLMAENTAEVLKMNPQGVIILHGTDTMHYTASALSFMLRDLSVPVVLTGSMIPGGDKDSDATDNLRDAVTVAACADMAEICIVFSADADRTKGMIIRGCRAKKIHSCAINAFASINLPPVGYVENGKISYTNVERRRRKDRELKLSMNLDTNVVLIKQHPGITSQSLARFLEGASGAVLEGTGVGHVRTDLLQALASFERPKVMTTQTIMGGEHLGMYDLDKLILEIRNLIPARDMNSETALVKLMWALRGGGDIRELMLTNIAGEISSS
jgi:glutamyl-tRNA(Gln) amidotransferase subunit D